jgi:hypothetical protein
MKCRMQNLTKEKMAEKLGGSEDSSSWKRSNPTTSKLVVLADLNVDPPEADPDDDDSSLPPPHIQITRFFFLNSVFSF